MKGNTPSMLLILTLKAMCAYYGHLIYTKKQLASLPVALSREIKFITLQRRWVFFLEITLLFKKAFTMDLEVPRLYILFPLSVEVPDLLFLTTKVN
tara:strand:- start:10773 stop:11060 length:288 start_codon:yes stop_codon:yes gene_type:complete